MEGEGGRRRRTLSRARSKSSVKGPSSAITGRVLSELGKKKGAGEKERKY